MGGGAAMRKRQAVQAAVLLPCLALAADEEDPFTWLEEVRGERALEWVKQRSAATVKELEAVPEFKPVFRKTLEILDSKEKIPSPELLGETVYNFWKDDRHERGLWRRTSLESYRAEQPSWETIIDVDALAKAEW